MHKNCAPLKVHNGIFFYSSSYRSILSLLTMMPLSFSSTPSPPYQKGATSGSAVGKKGKGVPWFAFGFIGVATVNSVWGIAPSLQKFFTAASAAFLGSAMAALGLDTDLVKVSQSVSQACNNASLQVVGRSVRQAGRQAVSRGKFISRSVERKS